MARKKHAERVAMRCQPTWIVALSILTICASSMAAQEASDRQSADPSDNLPATHRVDWSRSVDIVDIVRVIREMNQIADPHEVDTFVSEQHGILLDALTRAAYQVEGRRNFREGGPVDLASSKRSLAACIELYVYLSASRDIATQGVAQASKLAAMSCLQYLMRTQPYTANELIEFNQLAERLAWTNEQIDALFAIAEIPRPAGDAPKGIVDKLCSLPGIGRPGENSQVQRIARQPNGFAQFLATSDRAAVIGIAIYAEQHVQMYWHGTYRYLLAGGSQTGPYSSVRKILGFGIRKDIASRSLWPKDTFTALDLALFLDGGNADEPVFGLLAPRHYHEAYTAEFALPGKSIHEVLTDSQTAVPSGGIFMLGSTIPPPYSVDAIGPSVFVNDVRIMTSPDHDAFASSPGTEEGENQQAPASIFGVMSLDDAEVRTHLEMTRHRLLQNTDPALQLEFLLAHWRSLPFIIKADQSSKDPSYVTLRDKNNNNIIFQWAALDPTLVNRMVSTQSEWSGLWAGSLRQGLQRGEVWIIGEGRHFIFTKIQWASIRPIFDSWQSASTSLEEAVAQILPHTRPGHINERHLREWLLSTQAD